MAFTLSEEGIRYSRLFKSVMMPFNEIRSIIITKDGTSVTTRSGESYFQKEFTPVSVNDEFCNYMVKYNIEYRNDTKCIEGTEPYSREQLDPDEEVPDSYDNILLFFMTEWNPINQRGYYAVTVEVHDEKQFKSYVKNWSESLCADYQAYLEKEG